MAKKGHKPEEAVAKLRQVDVLVSQGQSVAEAMHGALGPALDSITAQDASGFFRHAGYGCPE